MIRYYATVANVILLLRPVLGRTGRALVIIPLESGTFLWAKVTIDSPISFGGVIRFYESVFDIEDTGDTVALVFCAIANSTQDKSDPSMYDIILKLGPIDMDMYIRLLGEGRNIACVYHSDTEEQG
jgi:hypothetical protein